MCYKVNPTKVRERMLGIWLGKWTLARWWPNTVEKTMGNIILFCCTWFLTSDIFLKTFDLQNTMFDLANYLTRYRANAILTTSCLQCSYYFMYSWNYIFWICSCHIYMSDSFETSHRCMLSEIFVESFYLHSISVLFHSLHAHLLLTIGLIFSSDACIWDYGEWTSLLTYSIHDQKLTYFDALLILGTKDDVQGWWFNFSYISYYWWECSRWKRYLFCREASTHGWRLELSSNLHIWNR